jgi:hypothetical protein
MNIFVGPNEAANLWDTAVEAGGFLHYVRLRVQGCIRILRERRLSHVISHSPSIKMHPPIRQQNPLWSQRRIYNTDLWAGEFQTSSIKMHPQEDNIHFDHKYAERYTVQEGFRPGNFKHHSYLHDDLAHYFVYLIFFTSIWGGYPRSGLNKKAWGSVVKFFFVLNFSKHIST